MAPDHTVLVIRPDGTASLIEWPGTDEDRRAVISAEIGVRTRMRRCGKGIVGFAVDSGADEQSAGRTTPTDQDSGPENEDSGPENECAAAAYAEQGVELAQSLHGPVMFARNPSKGSIVKPLTAAQTANLLAVTGARLV